jgi:hypothetical protein
MEKQKELYKMTEEKSQEQQPEDVAPEGQDTGEETGQPEQNIDVWGVLHYCIFLLHAQAWQAMGLTPSPVTHKIEKDLEQAKVAIDAAAYLAGQLEPKLQGQQLREMRAMISDLQINFVNQRS